MNCCVNDVRSASKYIIIRIICGVQQGVVEYARYKDGSLKYGEGALTTGDVAPDSPLYRVQSGSSEHKLELTSIWQLLETNRLLVLDFGSFS